MQTRAALAILALLGVVACGPTTGDAGMCARGHAGYVARCLYDSDCADPADVCSDSINALPGECYATGEPPGVCKRPCKKDSDCAGVGAGWCNPVRYSAYTQDTGVCAATCDPIANTGCGGTCQLFPYEGAARADCVGGGPDPCPAGQMDLATGGTGPNGAANGLACERLCRFDHPDDCHNAFAGVASVCLPVDSGALDDPSTGVSYGTCRAQCSSSAPCPNGTVCIDDVQPGKAPVPDCIADCFPSADSGPCLPYPASVNYPTDDSVYCLAPFWTSCTNACGSASDCPAGDACVPESKLPPGTCPGPDCASTCMIPPIACQPITFNGQAGCASGQACILTGSASSGWQTECVPAGTAQYPAACSTTDPPACAAGSGCTSYGDAQHGICEAYCYGSNCAANQACTAIAEIPQSPATDEIARCTTPCDLANPTSMCPKGMTCVEFEDASGTPTTDCIPATGSGTGAGGCTAGPLACAPGYDCRTSDGTCLPWCYVGQPASCSSGTCVSMNPALQVGTVAYGTCQ